MRFSHTSIFILLSGIDNTLDRIFPGLIPARFAKEIQIIRTILTTPLQLAYTKEERNILIKIPEVISFEDVELIIKSITLVPRLGLQAYLSFYRRCKLTYLFPMWIMIQILIIHIRFPFL